MKTFLKFILWLLLMITQAAMISCSTVHKNITSTKKVQDSTATVIKDTTSVAKVVAKNDNLTAKGVDITFNYEPDATATDTITAKPSILKPTATGEDNDDDQQFRNLIQDAVGNYATPGKIRSVTIHIDSVTNTTQKVFSTDSTNVKEKSTVNVKTNTDTKDKVISKSGLSFGTYAIIILVVVILLAVFIVKKFIL